MLQKERQGIIKAILSKRGFGFIMQEDGTDVFFHVSGIISPSFDELKEGMKVEYMNVESARGIRAIGVKLV